MTVKNTDTVQRPTESFTNSSNETRSVFYCPELPEFIWDLNHSSFKIIYHLLTESEVIAGKSQTEALLY